MAHLNRHTKKTRTIHKNKLVAPCANNEELIEIAQKTEFVDPALRSMIGFPGREPAKRHTAHVIKWSNQKQIKNQRKLIVKLTYV